MSISKQPVGLEHFKRAFATIDREGFPAPREATGQDLVFEGKRYPPKHAIALAVREATGVEPAASSFEFTETEQRWVRTLGLEVVDHVAVKPAAATFPLSDAAVRAEWERFIARRADQEPWMKDIRASVALARSDRETFVREDTQRALWSADDAIGVGMGFVDVKVAYTNAAVVELLWELRTQRLPDDIDARAEALRRAFDRLLQALKEAGVKRKPRAKLLRMFALLLPREGTTLLSEQSLLDVWKRLFTTPPPGFGPEVHVRIRARLRELLGDEPDDDACVERMVFCWLLQSTSLPQPPPISQLPFDQQYKGIPASSGFSESLRAMVREAQEPIRLDDLIAAWQTRTGKDGVSRKTFEARLSTWRTMGFLRLDAAGLCQATEDGLRLLDDDDVLITRLIEHVFGFAETLWFVVDSAQGLSSDELLQKQQSAYPNWTTAFAPNALTKWVEHFGLIERGTDARWRATDDGRSWAARVRRRTTPMPPKPTPPRPDNGDATTTLHSWSFATVAAELSSGDLVIDPAQLRALHAGWNASPTKHFVLLSGLSGTGKTQVVLRYARAVCAQLGRLEDTHITLVAVSPDWHDPSALLGYVNPLHDEQTFVRGAILPLLLHAAEDPAAPHFLVLDEMNLAPVERYFAPLLSSMETGSPLQLHNEDNDIDGVPASLRWPSNLFIAGTVNLDETTHAFSDKVLDRAFTLEYWRVDLPAFFAKLRESDRARYDTAAALACMDVLQKFYDHLEPTRRQFGYRSAREALDFVIVGVEQCGGDASEFIDAAVFGKVLPRVRGEDTPQLRTALEGCIGVAKSASLARCEQKLNAMKEQLTRVGMTKFAS